MNKITVYEYSSIVCPGALFLYILINYSYFHIDISSCGGFGCFLILSFCAGNLLQGIANILENMLWNPSNYTAKQLEQNNIKESPRDIYSFIHSNKGIVERIDIFNRQYGLMRGMSVCFLIITVLSIIDNWIQALIPFLCCLISLYRAFRFAKYYSYELIVEYKVKIEKNKDNFKNKKQKYNDKKEGQEAMIDTVKNIV